MLSLLECTFTPLEYLAQFHENPPADGIIGYIDRDGIEGVSENEEVHIGDSIEAGVVVKIQCSNWWVQHHARFIMFSSSCYSVFGQIVIRLVVMLWLQKLKTVTKIHVVRFLLF